MRMHELTEQHLALWWEEGGAADWGPVYAAAEQREREAELARFQDELSAAAEVRPRTAQDRTAVEQRILAALQGVARAMGLESQIGTLVRSGMVETAKSFLQQARRFDPSIGGDELFQGGRNVWTMNGLQLLLGLPVQVTPAVLAYSLLYPYSDNYLDDPAVPEQTKAAFNGRLGRRLLGEKVEPANRQEQAVFDLVGMIEQQFERGMYPDVFRGLSAIHAAQERSVRLLRGGAPPYEVDVLGISLEKGGSSVLADGYLVAGTLTPPQAQFMFGFGAFLQLVDDLQDVRADGQAGLLTVFSHSAGRWPLDALAERAWRFGSRVLEQLVHFNAPGTADLKTLMRLTGAELLINAAGSAGRLFTAEYLRELERHSPFRFAFLRKRRKKLSRQRLSLGRLIEAFAATES